MPAPYGQKDPKYVPPFQSWENLLARWQSALRCSYKSGPDKDGWVYLNTPNGTVLKTRPACSVR